MKFNLQKPLNTMSTEELLNLEGDIHTELVKRLEYKKELTRNKLSRKDVVLKARNEIETLRYYDDLYRIKNGILVRSTFIENAEKRTVVCILKGHVTNDIYSKGIAKCDPDDVFNAYIGKAIALYRALKYDVPEYLFNAPQPKQIKEGDVVKSKHTDNVYIINTQLARQGEANYAGINSVVAHDGILLDDTDREEYK